MISPCKRLLYKIIAFCTKFIGKIHIPFSRKKLGEDDVNEMVACMQPGDVILTRTNGEGSTAAIPGYWKHSALYIGNGSIIDATDRGVRERPLWAMIMKTDRYSILRLKDITPDEANILVNEAKTHIGKAYDHKLQVDNDDEIFCSELVYGGVEVIRPGYLPLEDIWGFDTYTPNNIYESDKFTLLKEKK